jgi:sulfite reductase (NADPH) flavoprotein alpha-component
MPEPTVIPTLPESAPFSPEQRAWLNGYFAGVFYDRPGASGAGTPTPPARPALPLLVAFGSQTGSAQSLAKKFAKEAERRGFAPVVKELNAVSPPDLAKASRCVVITSTWGDGDPPDNAAGFWAQLSAETAPKLENLAFAVLGLGDKNYAEFCGASKKFDERLVQLGAKRLVPRGECDVDYEATAKAWLEVLWPALESESVTSNTVISDQFAAAQTKAAASNTASLITVYSRQNPFPARLKTNRRLNGAGSQKDTRHFEIVLEGSGLSYEAGDALGVVPTNCPALVEELLAALGFKGDELLESVPGKNDLGPGTRNPEPTTLHEALLRTFVITAPAPALVKDAATRAGNAELLALLDPARKTELDRWLYGRDVVDVLRACPGAKFTPAEFVAHLRKLQPRLYSISSSPKAHPGEVHLTVAAVRYDAHGRAKKGVCSGWLADRVALDETPVPVFVQTSHGFRLPGDLTKPVIMIGPGTGIAPFRAFLEERRATGASGKNWLFFGDQQRANDFLYEEELGAWVKDGSLTRLDLAFSRDQAEKIYVQTRMLEQAAELWAWLEAGAHVYVCGDAKRMAKDVDAALHKVIAAAGGRTPEQAAEYVAALKAAKRYQRDVY